MTTEKNEVRIYGTKPAHDSDDFPVTQSDKDLLKTTIHLMAYHLATTTWKKVLCNGVGELLIDLSNALQNPPQEDDATHTPTSEWAYDHWKDANVHHTKFTNAEHDVVARHPLANLDPLVCSEAEADTKITTHAGDALLHHVSWTAISVYLSAQQDLVSGVITRVNFDRELYDTQAEWSTFTQVFTAKTAGKYLVTFNAHLAETIGLGDEFTMYIVINADYSDAVRVVEGGTILAGQSISRVYDFAIDDTIEFRVKMTYSENRKLHTNYTRATITRLL